MQSPPFTAHLLFNKKRFQFLAFWRHTIPLHIVNNNIYYDIPRSWHRHFHAHDDIRDDVNVRSSSTQLVQEGEKANKQLFTFRSNTLEEKRWSLRVTNKLLDRLSILLVIECCLKWSELGIFIIQEYRNDFSQIFHKYIHVEHWLHRRCKRWLLLCWVRHSRRLEIAKIKRNNAAS